MKKIKFIRSLFKNKKRRILAFFRSIKTWYLFCCFTSNVQIVIKENNCFPGSNNCLFFCKENRQAKTTNTRYLLEIYIYICCVVYN